MKIILIRHGAYDDKKNLSSKGKEQYILLSEFLKLILEGNINLISSPAPRAIQSAEVLGNNLKLKIDTYYQLWSDNNHPYDFDWFESLLKARELEGCDTLIIVSHLEYVQDFPRKLGLPSNNAGYAEGVIIETSSMTQEYINY